MAVSVENILRLYHTLRYLEPVQLAFLLLRRGLPAIPVKPGTLARVNEELYLQPLLPVTTFQDSENSFTCLNQTIEFEESHVNWNPSNSSRLWCYHLHYFDQLRDTNRSMDNKQFLLENWIKNNPQGTHPAWEPYTASLRIVNWVAFMLGRSAPKRLPTHWLDSLYEQTLWLERNDERHILANHYFENIKALLFAGVFFQGSNATRWLNRGKRLLLEQLSEQFLDDGGHYERSPHYHALMLENLLDLLNLSKSNSGILGVDVETALENCVERGLAFLHRITTPDGTVPLLNDSVKNAAPSVAKLYEYAGNLYDIKPPYHTNEIELINEPDSGLYGYRRKGDMLLIDCGDIGPDYQPGHTHCDFLSFELMLDGQMLVVDSGVYEYQAGKMRSYVRSTAAHNTVSVDGQEQSEIWGEFRVARRAEKLQADIAHTEDGCIEFRGSYSGFPQVAGRITHQRKILCEFKDNGDSFVINDLIQGKGIHRIDSFLHFHPDIELIEKEAGRWSLVLENRVVAQVTIMHSQEQQISTRIESGWYCPEFGIRQENKSLIISTTTDLPAEVSYKIVRAD